MIHRKSLIGCALLSILVGCGDSPPPSPEQAVASGGGAPPLATLAGGHPLPMGGAGGGVGGFGGGPVAGSGGNPEGGFAGAGGVSGNQASILTWNLENFPHTNEARARAAELLTALDPDVAALQEIAEPAEFYELLDELPGYDGFLNLDPGAYQRIGILYKEERVAVTDVLTIFRDDWYPFPRPPLTVGLTIDAPTPIDFVVVIVHLKAMVDAESQARRRAGCEALDGWVRAEQQGGAEQDYILLGDFNDSLVDPPEWNVFAPFLEAPDQYRALTLPLAEAGAHSYIPFESLIDHVIVTTDMLTEVGAGHAEVLALEATVAGYEALTDHRPVRTWLRW